MVPSGAEESLAQHECAAHKLVYKDRWLCPWSTKLAEELLAEAINCSGPDLVDVDGANEGLLPRRDRRVFANRIDDPEAPSEDA